MGALSVINLVFGSDSDRDKILPGIILFTRENPERDVRIHYASADNTPDKVLITGGDTDPVTVIVNPDFASYRSLGKWNAYCSGAGLSNVLTGVIKSRSEESDLNVGIPISDSSSKGLTSFLSTVEKPPRNPVLAVGVNNTYAGLNVVHRFLTGLDNVFIVGNGEHEGNRKLESEAGRVGLDYTASGIDSITEHDVVIHSFLPQPDHHEKLLEVDRRLAKGKGVQIGVSVFGIDFYGGKYHELLNDTSATGFVTSQGYVNAIMMAAILTRNTSVIDKIYEEREAKARKLEENRGLLISRGEVKEL